MIKNKHLQYWIALTHLVDGKHLLTLFNNFETGEHAWNASNHELLKAGLPTQTANRIIDQKNRLNPEKCLYEILDNNVSVLTLTDKIYPTLLKNISDPPAILFYRGHFPNTEKMLGVVGSRKLTPYNKTVGLTLTRDLARHKIIQVSGLARGIDGMAHAACIEQGTPTVAVVGTGLLPTDTYPTQHKKLAEQIVSEGGLLVSEYPPGSLPLQYHFPMRNRIIAGLTKGTLVIAAAQKSGALITAYSALDENREVFAVPGPITDQMQAGSNSLLKRGAHVVTEVDDILKIMEWDIQQNTYEDNTISMSEDEKNIYQTINKSPLHIDELVDCVPLDKQTVLTQVTILELKGFIKDIGGKRYIRL
jgi:DNA processing protein